MKLDLSQEILDTQNRKVVDTPAGPDGKPSGPGVPRTLRQNLIRILSSQFDRAIIKEPREYTWVYELTQVCNSKENVVEVDDEKIEFLKRLVGNNKLIYFKTTPQGLVEQEGFIFTPFEAGQTLKMLEVK